MEDTSLHKFPDILKLRKVLNGELLHILALTQPFSEPIEGDKESFDGKVKKWLGCVDYVLEPAGEELSSDGGVDCASAVREADRHHAVQANDVVVL